MKRFWILAVALTAFVMTGCVERQETSDTIQQAQGEKLLAEATAQVGMPAIKNFRERKILKDILELRDQNGLITYTYIENLQPAVVRGRTALGGKFSFLGETVGYGIPYATQFTSPQKLERIYRDSSGFIPMPQADPNGLFSPASAEGTWVLMKDPNGKDTLPIYIEPRILVSPFKLPAD